MSIQPTPPPTPTPAQVIPAARPNFFAALFDVSFSTLVAPRVIRVLYVLLLALIALGLVGFIVAAVASGSGSSIIIALIVAPLVALLYVIYARVLLEVIIAIFRLLESNREIAHLQRQQLTLAQQQAGVAPSAPGGLGGPPPYQPPAG